MHPSDSDPLAPFDTETPKVTPEPTPTLQPVAVTGIMQALAAMIGKNESILVCVTRLGADEIMVNIQPAASDKANGTAVPMQVTGTPEDIDANLVSALTHYVPARQYATKTASEVAEDIKAAADLAKADAAKAAAASAAARKTSTTPKIAKQELTVTVEDPSAADATITATLGAEIHTLRSGVPYLIAAGKYTLRTLADGRKTDERPITIGSEPVTVTVTLENENPSLFGGS